MNHIKYELIDIEKKNGLTEADSLRKGKQYYITLLKTGASAILAHADNDKKALVTSSVKDIVIAENMVQFTTQNTTYTLRRVV